MYGLGGDRCPLDDDGGILRSYGMSQMIDRTTGRLRNGLVMPASDSVLSRSATAISVSISRLIRMWWGRCRRRSIRSMGCRRPSFVLHTGDLTHLAQADEFDTLDQSLKSVRTEKIFFVPGEHDIPIMGSCTWSDLGRGRRVTAGIALIRMGFIYRIEQCYQSCRRRAGVYRRGSAEMDGE